MARRRFKRKAKDNSEVKSMGKIKHKKTEIDGITFHSKMESDYYIKLKADKAAGLIHDFTLQPKFTLVESFIVVNGETIYKSDERFNKIKRQSKAPTVRAIEYISDFLITRNDGTSYIVDTKGLSTPEFEIKRKLFTALYPTIPLEVVIYDKPNDQWVDFYEYNKAKRAAKKAKQNNKTESK